MKLTGILMRPPMVRGLLDREKWETRRPMKPQPVLVGTVWFWSPNKKQQFSWGEFATPGLAVEKLCPYGGEGDGLYVRETIRRVAADSPHSVYEADGAATRCEAWPWKSKVLPSMHMPRGCARVFLTVTHARAERLLEITDDAAIAEGFPRDYAAAVKRFGYEALFKRGAVWDQTTPRENYFWFLDQIHGEGYSLTNPWVWVLEFAHV